MVARTARSNVEQLRVVLLEDSPLDAELILARLAEGGFACAAERVETRESFLAALGRCEPDLILADYSLPQFDGISALEIAREKCPDVPFLFVSGALGEERAIETLKCGATDYVLKDRPERLVPSVRRALREAGERAERQRLEEALRRRLEELAETDRRRNEFLAMLAHELRNPLAPIRHATLLLGLSGIEDNPTLAWAREVIERQVRHLSRLVDDLLEMSRLTRGKIRLAIQTVELASAVGQAVETVRPLVAAKQQELTTLLPPEPIALEADPPRLVQVLANLLDNAAKYTPAGGKIAVGAEVSDDEVVFRVSDTGIGMPPELLAKVFELFTQAEQNLARSPGGLGIGLTLVRRLVEMHGGSVSAHSEGPDRGSTFTVRLPLRSKLPREEAEGAPAEDVTENA